MSKSKPNQDARMRVESARDDRETRGTRSELADAPRREAEVLTEAELRASIRSEFVQESLPSIKPPPGWHYCWLAATSPYDPIHKRMRLGYLPVPFSELVENGVENFDQYKISSGDLAGGVQCNEMVLFKLPQERYQLIMSEFHHNMPLEEERAIRERALAENVQDREGNKLVQRDAEDTGLESLGTDRRAPTFV